MTAEQAAQIIELLDHIRTVLGCVLVTLAAIYLHRLIRG